MDVNFPDTCFQAGAILRAREMKDLNGMDPRCRLRLTEDTLEQERREVLEAIVSEMGGREASESWDVHRRLLEHLAQPPRRAISRLVH